MSSPTGYRSVRLEGLLRVVGQLERPDVTWNIHWHLHPQRSPPPSTSPLWVSASATSFILSNFYLVQHPWNPFANLSKRSLLRWWPISQHLHAQFQWQRNLHERTQVAPRKFKISARILVGLELGRSGICEEILPPPAIVRCLAILSSLQLSNCFLSGLLLCSKHRSYRCILPLAFFLRIFS